MKVLYKGVMLLILTLLIASSAAALPVGTIAPEEGRGFVGVKLSFDERDLDNAWELDRNLYVMEAGYSFTDRITFFVHLGLSDPDVTEYSVDSDFAFGVGARGVLLDREQWRLNGFAEYLWSGGHNLKWRGMARGEIGVDEWQIGLTAQTDLENFSPYIGIRYSDVNVNGDFFPKQNGNDVIGFVLGADVPLRRDITVNVEGHLVDETGVSIGLTYYLY